MKLKSFLFNSLGSQEGGYTEDKQMIKNRKY